VLRLYNNRSDLKKGGLSMIRKKRGFLLIGLIALAVISTSVLYCEIRGGTEQLSYLHGVANAGSPDVPEEYAALKETLETELKQENDITYGIFFKDIESGSSFGINSNEPITAASTVKLPVVLYLNQLVAAGELDWNDRVVYESSVDWQDGAGILQFTANDGDSFSLRVLANLSITISDNIAYRMLMRHLGRDNVIDFMQGLGGKIVFPEGRNITCAKDMGLYLEEVLAFAKAYPDLGSRLLDDMSHPIYHVGIPGNLPKGVVVAHKEGDVSGVSNDVGIVFTDKPYILVVLSKNVPDIDEGFAEIARISKIVYDYRQAMR
jgi:beta-lactamase class A